MRSGAYATALAQLDDRFAGVADGSGDAPAKLLEDIAALRARIAKDHALATPESRRAPVAGAAAAAYEAVFDRFHRSYSCINAATLWLLAGDAERSRRLAGAALADPGVDSRLDRRRLLARSDRGRGASPPRRSGSRA